jgi:hypothetical protein
MIDSFCSGAGCLQSIFGRILTKIDCCYQIGVRFCSLRNLYGSLWTDPIKRAGLLINQSARVDIKCRSLMAAASCGAFETPSTGSQIVQISQHARQCNAVLWTTPLSYGNMRFFDPATRNPLTDQYEILHN